MKNIQQIQNLDNNLVNRRQFNKQRMCGKENGTFFSLWLFTRIRHANRYIEKLT